VFEAISNNLILGYFFIFFARVADVSLDVFRLLLLTRGYALQAALIGFVEVCIFVIALGAVLSGGPMDILKIITYAGGFATGNLVGAYLEDKMAVGYTAIHIYCCRQICESITTHLRNKNFGVTRLTGEGRSGPRDILIITAKRKDLPFILGLLEEVAPDTFYNVSDIRSLKGGIFPHRRP
jgi:uncharacterized protein YebE (UPF0316 family)